MKTVLVSEFKTHCVGLLHEVETGRQELLITRRGRPVARVVPAASGKGKTRVAGDSVGVARMAGDIVETDAAAAWESL